MCFLFNFPKRFESKCPFGTHYRHILMFRNKQRTKQNTKGTVLLLFSPSALPTTTIRTERNEPIVFNSLNAAILKLIFHKQEVASGVLAEDLDGLLGHLHDGGVPRVVPEHLEPHVLWLEQTWSHREGGGGREEREGGREVIQTNEIQIVGA